MDGKLAKGIKTYPGARAARGHANRSAQGSPSRPRTRPSPRRRTPRFVPDRWRLRRSIGHGDWRSRPHRFRRRKRGSRCVPSWARTLPRTRTSCHGCGFDHRRRRASARRSRHGQASSWVSARRRSGSRGSGDSREARGFSTVAQRHSRSSGLGVRPGVGRLHRERPLGGAHDEPRAGIEHCHLIGVTEPAAEELSDGSSPFVLRPSGRKANALWSAAAGGEGVLRRRRRSTVRRW